MLSLTGKRILVVLTACLVAAAGLVWLADSWLESGPGRARLESALEDALGEPVSLRGEFSVSLLPNIGVSGDGLSIGRPDGAGLNLSSERFHVSVSVLPLLRGDLRIIEFRAADGTVGSLAAGEGASSSEHAGRTVRLPRVDLFELTNFRLPMVGEDWILAKLELNELRPSRAVPLAITLTRAGGDDPLTITLFSRLVLDEPLELIELSLESVTVEPEPFSPERAGGIIRWDRVLERVEADLSGRVRGLGQVDVDWSHSLAEGGGAAGLEVVHDPSEERLSLEADYRWLETGASIDRVQIVVSEQAISGGGCFRSQPSLALDLSLSADRLDLDRLMGWFGEGQGEGGAPGDLPLEINLRLDAARLDHDGIRAEQVVVEVGDAPLCEFDDPARR